MTSVKINVLWLTEEQEIRMGVGKPLELLCPKLRHGNEVLRVSVLPI